MSGTAVLFKGGLLAAALLLATPQVVFGVRQRPPAWVVAPATISDDFQENSLGQWASYPPPQDIGYEPSLSPTSDYGAPGGRALMRIVKPNREGPLRFGFIKRVRMLAGGEGRLRFSYRLNAPAAGGYVEVGLAGADGRLYKSRFAAKTNEWSSAEVRLAELRSADGRTPAEGVGFEAAYILADLARAVEDFTYRFMIDDVSLAAAREARFAVNVPRTESIEPWAALLSARGYRPGDAFAVEAAAPVPLTRAEITLAPRGGRAAAVRLYDDGTHGDQRAGDGVWSNAEAHRFGAHEAAGVWDARLTGAGADGKSVNTEVQFLVRSGAGVGHPRLYFGATDREKLIGRTRDPKTSKLWEHLQTTAKNTRATGDVAHGGAVFEMLDREYLLPSLLAYFDVLNRARTRIAHNAFEAYITGSPEARDAAKSAMLAAARWGRWAPPWFEAHGQHTYYPAGQLAADMALGYDLLYDDLSEEERSLVRRALIEKSVAPTYAEYVADNRAMANTSNWIAHTVGGALIAATAIADEVTDEEAGGRFNVYLNGLLRKLEDHIEASYLGDGSYGEGISYYEFDAETLGPALVALERNFGADYLSRTHVLDSYTYPLYTLAWPTSASLDMGDTHPPAGHGIPALIYRSKDPVARWYYGQFDRPSLAKFIFFDDSVAPRSPAEAALPTSRMFGEKGNAVFRSGWGKDDWIFLYRAGPNFNHHHADQGAFLLSAFGEQLVTEAGWSDYYKDPYYATFFTQAVGHSTLLVDGDPGSQRIADTPQFGALDAYPRITDAITSDFYDALGSELSPVYGGRLSRYERRVVFVKPHYFVVFDDVAASGAPARFDWLLHLPDRARITHSAGLALYTGERAALAVRSLAPAGAELHVRDGRVPYHVFAANTPPAVPAQPAYLDWRSASPALSAQFLSALVPARKAEDARSLAGRMSLLAGERAVGLSAERGAERDLVMFRTGGEGGVARQGAWAADAAAWTVTLDGERLKLLAAQSARSVTRAGRALLASEAPVSFAANYLPGAIVAAASAGAPTRVRLAVTAAPARVRVNGRELSPQEFSYEASGGMLSLVLPAGASRIEMTLR
jgi:hypothetical protein